MEKIFRLSWANIRKRRMEAVSLLILVLMCMTMLGSSLAGTLGIRALFPQVLAHTGSYENFMLLSSKVYDKKFETILKDDPRVEKAEHAKMLYDDQTEYMNPQGKPQSIFLAFITMEQDIRLEQPEIETTLTDAEIAALEHPVYMPYAAKNALQLQCGDAFTVAYGAKKYPFTVAGFYDTLLFNNTVTGLKLIVNEKDYYTLGCVLGEYDVLAFNDHQGADDKIFDELIEAFEGVTTNDIRSSILFLNYKSLEAMITSSIDILLKVIIVMAAIIILSVAFMIRFRIAGDIKEQIVSIGVLEALGYTSGNITASYVLEYLLITLAGVIPGIGLCFVLTPALLDLGDMICGHNSSHQTPVLPILLTAVGILLFVAVIAFVRARAVRHFPPVTAFRKGQGDNHFGKEVLPLRNTRSSVHLRLAMKGFLQNVRQNLGLTFCIAVSSFAIVFCFIIFCFFGNDLNAIVNSSGYEMSDMRITVMAGDDAKAFADELRAMPEVRKATPTSSEELYVTMRETNAYMLPVSYEDFGETENIFPMTGRYPEHDNEVMISVMMGKIEHMRVGDSITLDYCNVQRKYIITGLVTSCVNGGVNLYITEDGLKRLIPTYRPPAVDVYLEDGVDADAFRETITALYGRSITDAAQDGEAEGSYEDRIRAEAERRIAEMMGVYGVSHVEYAIQVGDRIISGNSSAFRIKSIMRMAQILETQLSSYAKAIAAGTVIFMLLAALVVMIILFILMESSVRKQRREFGIMKAMGYQSKELMFQLACRIVPSALVAVIAGTAAGTLSTGLLASIIGRISINIPGVILLDLVLLVFCFVCAYIGARKIKTISVCELMTE